MKHLRCLLCNNNKISRLEPNLGSTIPGLQSLILTNNRLTSLGDITGLDTLVDLRSLSLIQNPV
eukprot:SAG31_NODE_42775_length_270_cov_0.602339_1_plen_63_part_01